MIANWEIGMDENTVIENFIDIAASSITDSMEDVDFFYLLMNGTDIQLSYEFDVDKESCVLDYSVFPFDVISDDGNIELGFVIAIADADLESKVAQDMYYIDISSSIDVSVDDANVGDALDILDGVNGFYVDPIRPFSWVVSEKCFDSTTTVDVAAKYIITSLQSFFNMEIVKDKKPSHLKLVAKDGNIIN